MPRAIAIIELNAWRGQRRAALERYVKVREEEAKGRILAAFAPTVEPLKPVEVNRREAS